MEEPRATCIIDCIGDCRRAPAHSKFADAFGLNGAGNGIAFFQHQDFYIRYIPIYGHVVFGQIAVDEMSIQFIFLNASLVCDESMSDLKAYT